MIIKCLIGSACLLAWNLVFAEAGKKTLQVAYNENFFPFSYREKSELRGLEIELMNELGKRMDLEIVHHGYPWNRAQAMVAEGKTDAFVTVTTPARLKYSSMSRNFFFKTNIVAATSVDNLRLQTLLKIKDLKGALKFSHVNGTGSGWAKAFLANTPVTYIDSPESIFKFLLANRADLYVESENNIRLNIKRLKLQDKIVVLPVVFSTVEFRLGISKRSVLVSQMQAFDDTIKKMNDDGTSSRIFTKWLYEAGDQP